LDIQDLFINFLGGHSASEEGGCGQISAVSGIGGAHHVFGVEHLLGEFRDGEGSVLLRSSGGQGGEPDHEEMETGEGDQVDGEFSEIRIELTGESQAAGDAGHSGGDQMIEITVGGGGEFEGSEADIVEGFVVDDHAFVGVLDQLMDGEGAVVGFNDGIGDLGRGDDGEGFHDSVGIFFSDFGDEQGAHAGAGSSSEGLGDLEALKTIAAFSLLSDDVQN